MKNLLKIYWWICQWKNFENQSTLGEVVDNIIVACLLLTHSVVRTRAFKRKSSFKQCVQNFHLKVFFLLIFTFFSYKNIGKWHTHIVQGSAVAYKPARRAASRRANVLQTNKVDAQCLKLATELSWERFASKVANLQLPHLHLTYPACIWRLWLGDPVWVLPRFSASEN